MKLYTRSVSMQGGSKYAPQEVEITGVLEGAGALGMIRAGDGVIDLDPYKFPDKVVVKCDHCGQWCAVKTACKHCGAPVGEGPKPAE